MSRSYPGVFTPTRLAMVATTVVLLGTSAGAAAAGPTIKFDGPAGAGQTSPTSPAVGKITATGSYDNAGSANYGVTVYYREKDTDPWTAMPGTLDTTNKTWSAVRAGLPSNKAYKVKAQITVIGQMQETDVRTVTTK